MPGRQRLCRGIDSSTPLPRSAAELDMGRFGNVVCLDVLRTIRKEPGSAEAFLAELRLVAGSNAAFDDNVRQLEAELSGPVDEGGARRLTERMAKLLGASLLIRYSPAAISDAVFASRPANPAAIIEAAFPI